LATLALDRSGVLFSSVIALAAAGAMADDITADNTPSVSTATRAQVKAEVLKARKSGELLGAGEIGQRVRPPVFSASRSDVVTQFRVARVNGELLAAGEGLSDGNETRAHESNLARADVKAETIAARMAGELLPAGEGYYNVEPFHHNVASSGNPFQSVAKLFRRLDDSVSQ
jgi:vancomycin permeability regulator SanA